MHYIYINIQGFVAGQPMANNANVAEYSTVEVTGQLAGGKLF